MSPSVEVAIFEAAREPAQLLRARLAQQGLAATCRDMAQTDNGAPWSRPDVAVIIAGQEPDRATVDRAGRVLARLVGEKVATVVWGTVSDNGWPGGALVEWVDPRVSLDEVVGRLTTLARYVPLVRQLERELEHIHRLGGQLNRYISEIDQEMRLAGRLQRDFLPGRLPEVPGLRFAALYRPASWVSGDMYDAFRIDERHLGMFIADAMGHGVAAGLMTMFLRQALVPKDINGSAYSIRGPAEAMVILHDCLLRQHLPSCQFVTAVYALYDLEHRELRLARAGHPYPLHIRAGGQIEAVCAGGSLLGLADVPPEFEEVRVHLQSGDKVVLFTDGLEDDFFLDRKETQGAQEYSPALRDWARLDVRDLVDVLNGHLDGKAGSLHPADDVTLLAFQAD